MQNALKFDNTVIKTDDNFSLDSAEIIDNDLVEQKSELVSEIENLPKQNLFEKNDNN
jgi:hypothetical protein